MASTIPKFVKKEIVDAWVAESLYLMLLDNSYTPDAANHQYAGQAAVVSKRLAASGPYPVEGVPITAGKIQSYDTNNAFLDATDLSIGPAATLNYRYGVIYALKGGGLATSPIRCIIDFGSDQIVTNGTSVIEWNALGIIYVS
jgi:hypothetical protein